MLPLKVIPLTHTQESKEEILANLDNLRKSIEAGDIVGFAAVGIAPNDDVKAWAGNCGRKTQLQFMGAVSFLQHGIMHGLD